MSESYITLRGKGVNEGPPSYVWLFEKEEDICAQISRGLDNVNAMQQFVKKVSSSLQGKNVESLVKGLSLPNIEKDECKTFAREANAVSENARNIIKAEITFADQVKEHFSSNLKAFYKENLAAKNKIESDLKSLRKNLKSAENDLIKTRNATETKLKKLKKTLPTLGDTSDHKIVKKRGQLKSDMTKSLQQYENKYKKVRDQKIMFYTQILPSKLEELEKIERMRLHIVTNMTQKYVQVVENYLNKVTRFHQQAVDSFKSLDAKTEFDEYVKAWMLKALPNEPVNDIPYGLPCKSTDIANLAFNTIANPDLPRKDLTDEYKGFEPIMYKIPDISYCDNVTTKKTTKWRIKKKSQDKSTESKILESEYEIKHAPRNKALILTSRSPASEVELYLAANSFDASLFKGKNGQDMFDLTKDQCKAKYGVANGIRLFNRLNAFKIGEVRN